MSIMDAQIIRNLIDEFGATVIVREVSRSSSNKYGDMTETKTDHTGLKAFAQTMTADDEEVKEGVFKTGDIIFHFKPDYKKYIKRQNRIVWNNRIYEIDEVVEHVVGDETLVIEARVKIYTSKPTESNTLNSQSIVSTS